MRHFLSRWFGAPARGRAEREIREEVELHLAELAEEFVAAGMTPGAARRAAERRFGNVENIVNEGVRQRRGSPLFRIRRRVLAEDLMSDLLYDVRFAVRMMRKSPGFTALAVISLALGIGFNTTVFSLVDALLLAPHGARDAHELVRIVRKGPDMGDSMMSYPDLVDVREAADAFTGVAGFATVMAPFNDQGNVELLFGESISPELFDVLRVPPLLGRSFTPEENTTPGGHAVVMIGERLWRGRLGGDPDVIGRDMVLAGRPYTVVGVVPSIYEGATPPIRMQFWIPTAMDGLLTGLENGQGRMDRRRSHSLGAVARLAPGVTRQQAESELQAIAASLAEAHPETNAETDLALMRYDELRIEPSVDRMLTPVAGVLMGVVSLILLIACANVANMLLARASTRAEEVAVRRALGASGARLVRQLLTESVLLALVGGVLGAGLAALTVRGLLAVPLPLAVPLSFDIGLNLRVLGFTALAALMTGILFGVLPAVQGARLDVAAAMKSGARGGQGARAGWMRSALVVAQVAVSLVLLISAALLMRSLANARAIEPGIATTGIVALSTELGLQGYPAADARRLNLEALERIGRLPGVERVGFAERMPLEATITTQVSIWLEDGRPDDDADGALSVDSALVTPDYFEVLGIGFVGGRAFRESDDASSLPVAIVNPAFADRYWPGESALGKRLSTSGPDGPFLEVVGVNAAHKIRTLGEEPTPHLYLPYAQDTGSGLGTIVARIAAEPAPVLEGMRRVVREIDPNIAIFRAATIEQHLGQSLYLVRLAAWSLAGLGLIGAVLAAAGVYGVVAFVVSRRTREIGIRMAIGADRGRVEKMVVREGMRSAAVGLLVGVAASALATRVLASLLYGISATDWIAFGAATALLLGVALVANLLPARRAARVHPATALRTD